MPSVMTAHAWWQDFDLFASLELLLDVYILMKETMFTTFLRFAEHECYPRTGLVCRDLQQMLSVCVFLRITYQQQLSRRRCFRHDLALGEKCVGVRVAGRIVLRAFECERRMDTEWQARPSLGLFLVAMELQ